MHSNKSVIAVLHYNAQPVHAADTVNDAMTQHSVLWLGQSTEWLCQRLGHFWHAYEFATRSLHQQLGYSLLHHSHQSGAARATRRGQVRMTSCNDIMYLLHSGTICG